MRWRVLLAAWLLKADVVDLAPAETIIFIDHRLVDFDELGQLTASGPLACGVTFVPVFPISDRSVRDGFFAVRIPPNKPIEA